MDSNKGKSREGVRGGLEQFRWDSLKNQPYKDREHYLGYTTKLGVIGRFGQYQRNDWWRTDNQSLDAASSHVKEKTQVKKMEDELMMEALGMKPKRLMLAKSRLSSEQVDEMLKKEDEVPSQSVNQPPADVKDQPPADDSVVVTGLGYRKYLKPTDWTGEVCNLDEEEVFELKGENVPVEKSIKKEEHSPRNAARGPPRDYWPRRDRSRSPRGRS